MVQSSAGRLAVVLLKTFGAISCGYVCVRFKYMDKPKGEVKGIAVFVGKIAFPLLIFRTVATANAGDVVWGVPIACTLVKIAAWCLAFFLSFFTFPTFTGESRLLMSALFGFFAVSSDDFSVGFPVIDALYPVNLYPQELSKYLTFNALVVSAFFVPVTLILLSIARASGGGLNREVCREILISIGTNPVLVMAFLGAVFQILYPGDLTQGLPTPLAEVIDLATSPFNMLALFLTGTNLKSMKLSRWPILIVMTKVIFCAFASSGLTDLLVPNTEEDRDVFLDFAFLYGSISTSSAPLIFAGEFAPARCELLATATMLGLLISGPTMFVSSLLFGQTNDMLAASLRDVTNLTGYVSAPCCAALVVLFILGRRWLAKPSLDIVVLYGLATCLYTFTKLFLHEALDCANPDSTFRKEYEGMSGYIFLPSYSAIFFSFFQNLCRALTVMLLVWRLRGFRKAGTWKAMGAAVGAAFVFAIITPPNTIKANCDMNSNVDEGDQWRTLMVASIFFAAMLLIFIFVSFRGAPPETNADDEEDHDRAQGFLFTGLGSPSKPHTPYSTSTILGVHCGVRLAIQVLLGAIIQARGAASAPSSPAFRQMQIVENLLEHTQPVLLLIIVLFNENFQPLMMRLMYRSPDFGEGGQHSARETQEKFDLIAMSAASRVVARRWLCWSYDPCITGAQLTDLLVDQAGVLSRRRAVGVGENLIHHGFLVQVDGKMRLQVFHDVDTAWYYINPEGVLDADLARVDQSEKMRRASMLLSSAMDSESKPVLRSHTVRKMALLSRHEEEPEDMGYSLQPREGDV